MLQSVCTSAGGSSGIESAAMQETQEAAVQSLHWEGPLEEEMATYSSIPAWRISWTEEPGRLRSLGLQESDTTERLNHTTPHNEKDTFFGF